jgi:hypothetical protein
MPSTQLPKISFDENYGIKLQFVEPISAHKRYNTTMKILHQPKTTHSRKTQTSIKFFPAKSCNIFSSK